MNTRLLTMATVRRGTMVFMKKDAKTSVAAIQAISCMSINGPHGRCSRAVLNKVAQVKNQHDCGARNTAKAARTTLAASTSKNWRNCARVSLRPKPSVPRVTKRAGRYSAISCGQART